MNWHKHIPNLITTINLIAGFIAILINDPFISPLLILAASILDLADGVLARLLNARSELGEQLDSFADLVSFGVAPAYLFYQHFLGDNWYELLAVAVFPALGAIRLAIFNVKKDQHTSFKGLPIPGSGLFIAFLVYAFAENGVEDQVFWHFGFRAVNNRYPDGFQVPDDVFQTRWIETSSWRRFCSLHIGHRQ
jgi:CDP-diacylglycerol--serine O-phosphatidyltransferase